jgi:hypothetical protein
VRPGVAVRPEVAVTRRAAVSPAALAIGVLALGLSFSSAASAEGPRPARPSLSAMPSESLPAPLDARRAPASIPRTATLSGITASTSRNWRKKQVLDLHAADRRCLNAGFLVPADGAKPSGRSMDQLAPGGVKPLRTERLVVSEAGAAVLEIVDAWADPGSGGVSEAARSTVPLTVVARAGGVTTYAFREGDALHLVVANPQQMMWRDDGGSTASSDCDHVRVRLELPQGVGGTTVSVGGSVPATGEKPRQRELEVSASLSRTTRDPEPVIAVSLAFTEHPAPSFTF